MHSCGDEHAKAKNDQDVDTMEEMREYRVPATMLMRCPKDSLREYGIDHKQEYNTGRDEDLGSYCYANGGRPSGPNNAHDACSDSGHAKSEHHTRHNELMSMPLIQLENSHMRNSPNHEEDEKNGGDGYVKAFRWDIPKTGSIGGIRGMLRAYSLFSRNE